MAKETKKEGQEEDKTMSPVEIKIKEVFENFPNVKRVWHDGENVFFSECKQGMELKNKTDSDE